MELVTILLGMVALLELLMTQLYQIQIRITDGTVKGLHGGTTVENCQVRKPINGVCNNSQRNGCSAGTLNDSAISDTSTHYRWHCEGLHGGTAAKNCQMVKTY